ncbi:MAG: hypothetical protein Q8N99_03025 [Nanoarchaeota archaeon]|nr:hypothetical protein [Nanoarchaeota archaeon]
MKTYSLLLIFLLVIGVISTVIVFAEEEDSNASDDDSDSEIVSDEGTITSDIQEGSNQSEDLEESIKESDRPVKEKNIRVLGVKTVTLAEGYSIKKDDSKAHIITGNWITGKYKRGNSSEELNFANGMIKLGLGNKMDKYKLVKKEISNKSASFYLLPINKLLNSSVASADNIGTLELSKKSYPDLDLWTGTLKVTSGKHIGEWSVNMVSKTKTYNNLVVRAKEINGKEIGEKAREKIQEKQEKIKEKVVQTEAKRPGFWARLFGRK